MRKSTKIKCGKPTKINDKANFDCEVPVISISNYTVIIII